MKTGLLQGLLFSFYLQARRLRLDLGSEGVDRMNHRYIRKDIV